MNKSELVNAMAKDADISAASAGRALESFISNVLSALCADDQVAIAGFGTFVVKERAAREGRNPNTGEKIQIARSVSPAFKPGKAFKDSVKEGHTSKS